MRAVRRAAPAPTGLGTELVGVPEGAPIQLHLRMESVMEGVLVSGTVTSALVGECARCLGPVSTETTAEVQELFVYPDSTTDETTTEDEVGHLYDDFLDLEPVLRDAIVLGLPLAPLCRPDCRGLCPTCGARWEDLPADHAHDTIDPRWAALAERLGDEHDSQE